MSPVSSEWFCARTRDTYHLWVCILGSFLVISTKIARLVVLRQQHLAKRRFSIVMMVILANFVLLGCYFGWLAARK